MHPAPQTRFAMVNTFEIDWIETSEPDIADFVYTLAVYRDDRDAVDAGIYLFASAGM